MAARTALVTALVTAFASLAVLACRSTPPEGAPDAAVSAASAAAPEPPRSAAPPVPSATPAAAVSAASAPAPEPTGDPFAPLDAKAYAAELHVTLVEASAKDPAPGVAEPLVTVTTGGAFVGTRPGGENKPAVVRAELFPQGVFDSQGLDDALGPLALAQEDAKKPLVVRVLVDGKVRYGNLLKAFYGLSARGLTSPRLLVNDHGTLKALTVSLDPPPEGAAIVRVNLGGAKGALVGMGATTVGAGCALGAAPPAVPGAGDTVDFAALERCMAKVRSLSPELRGATGAGVLAPSDVDAATLLRGIAAVAKAFPKIYVLTSP